VFTCEGDEDWCDPFGDAYDPEADLLAVWSRIEGDTLIMQLRFAAPPFRRIRLDEPLIAFSNARAGLAAGVPNSPLLCQDIDPPGVALCVAGNLRLSLSFVFGAFPCNSYPPTCIGTDLPATAPAIPIDRCAFRLGRTSPLLELRLPHAAFGQPDGGLAYGIDINAEAPGHLWDYSWTPGQPALVTTHGGRADDESDLVSFCELTCPTATP
jgi:hypothetical protein